MVNIEDFKNYITNYRVDYSANFDKYYSISKTVQQLAVADNRYASTISADPNIVIPYYRARILHNGSIDDSDFTDYYFDYTNPKKTLPISLGNLEYIYKYMYSRFLMNRFLYEGSDLETKNTFYAELFLDLIEELKTEVINSVQTMNTEYNNHRNNNYLSQYDGVVYLGYEKYDTTSDSWISCSLEESGNFDDLLEETVLTAYLDYLAPFAAELISLEIELKGLFIRFRFR